jgi:polysaccharide biosynthesis protein PelE
MTDDPAAIEAEVVDTGPCPIGRVLLVATGLGELALVTATMEGFASPLIWASHPAIAAMAAGIAVFCYRRGDRHPLVVAYPAGLLVLGPLAVLGTFAAIVVQQIGKRRSASFGGWYAQIFAGARDRIDTLYEALAFRGYRIDREPTVAPFLDVLRYGSFKEKQCAVVLVADHYGPELAPVLKLSLCDPEPAIRVQAATAAAKIEARFVRMLSQLQELHDEADTAVALRLIGCYADYANTGLVDEGRAGELRQRALALCDGALERHPGDRDLIAAKARLLVDGGAMIGAIGLLRPVIEKGAPSLSIIEPLAQALYTERRFGELRRLAASTNNGEINGRRSEFLSFWSDIEATEMAAHA